MKNHVKSTESRRKFLSSRKKSRNVIFLHTTWIDNFLNHFQESTSYIRTVFWCCICLQLFIHPSLLHLLPIPIIYTLIKKLWSKFGSKLTDLLNNHSFGKHIEFLTLPFLFQCALSFLIENSHINSTKSSFSMNE